MAYKYEGSARTHEGKIIYRRRLHRFTSCDLGRLADSIPQTDDLRYIICMLGAVRIMLLHLIFISEEGIGVQATALADSIRRLIEDLVGGEIDLGGRYGGAGTSRRWGRRPRWWLGKWKGEP